MLNLIPKEILLKGIVVALILIALLIAALILLGKNRKQQNHIHINYPASRNAQYPAKTRNYKKRGR